MSVYLSVCPSVSGVSHTGVVYTRTTHGEVIINVAAAAAAAVSLPLDRHRRNHVVHRIIAARTVIIVVRCMFTPVRIVLIE